MKVWDTFCIGKTMTCELPHFWSEVTGVVQQMVQNIITKFSIWDIVAYMYLAF